MSARFELLPCPFCGHESRVEGEDSEPAWNSGGGWIECINPACQVSSAVEFGEMQSLAARWNRRVPPTPSPEATAAVVTAAREWRDAWEALDPVDPRWLTMLDRTGRAATALLAALARLDAGGEG